jgi:hypothetical protein
MKKSMILAAAVVAAGLGTSANATFFRIVDAGSNGNGQLGNFNVQTDTVGSVIGSTGATDITTAGSGVRALNATAVADIVAMVDGALGSAVGATPRLTYFGMNNGGGDGYFAVVFQNNGTARDWSVNIGQAAAAGKGVFTNTATPSESYILGGAFITALGGPNPQLAANGVYVAIFAGMGVGAEIGGSNLSDTSFDVNYLDFDGSSYGSVASIGGAANSNINAATYNIPVPAPALLAGAGLVGAAAIRRRMAKKA